MTKKILVLTAPFGSGHLQVSKALIKELKKHKHIKVEEYDIYSKELPRLTKFLQKAYLKSYKGIGKTIYKRLYHLADKAYYGSSKLLTPLFQKGVRTLKKKLEEFEPDILILTFPVTSVHYLKSNINAYTVITDYYANALWYHKDGACHYIGSEHIASVGLVKGLDVSQFKLTGIPVNEKFYAPLDKEKIRKKYDLSADKLVVVVSTGAHGVLSKAYEVADGILNYPNMQGIIVCGSNDELYDRLATQNQGNPRILTYTEDMHELLEVADILVTKSGGVSLTEAAIKGVPVLMHNPLAGQEYENAKYFVEKDAGIIAYAEEELLSSLQWLASDLPKMEQMQQNMKNISQERSAEKIIRDIMEKEGWLKNEFL